MEIKNAVIRSTVLTTADYDGQLTCSIAMDYGSTRQSFGTYILYNLHYKEDKNFGGFFIYRCLEVIGVNEWSKLIGKPVRVRIGDNRLIEAIGHFIEDKWFCPEQEYTTLK